MYITINYCIILFKVYDGVRNRNNEQILNFKLKSW